MSLSAQFDEFLERGEQFGALALTGDDISTATKKGHNTSNAHQRRIILVEDFPSFLGQGSSGLSAFRASLQKYLAATVPSNGYHFNAPPDGPPIVMIVSEAMLGSASGTFDSFSSYRLLGPDISSHPGIGFIDFNPVAPTFMAKAIDLVLKKDARRTNRKQIPSSAALEQFYGTGDIRSAISAVEFFCLRNGVSGQWNEKPAASRSRKSSTKEPTATEKETLQMITQREASLGLFHATGKVVHNKRDHPKDVPDKSRILPNPPSHHQQHARPLVSQVTVDDLMSETGTDTSTFLASLHENFPLSCSGSSFTEYYDNCMEYLADADLLGSDSHKNIRSGRLGLGSARNNMQGYGGGIDFLRQDEISFQVGVRGLLFSLPYPVKRTVNSRAGRGYGDAHKMYYPTSAQLWRRTEELDGMVDHWVHTLTEKTKGSSVSANANQTGVESWQALPSDPSQAEHRGSDERRRALLSREDVLLERLPYLRRITQDQTERASLEQLTRFTGIGSRWSQYPEEEPEPTDSPPAMEQTDDRKLLAAAKQRPAGFQRFRKDPLESGTIETTGDAIEKLALSDDDIEDD
ncbi:golgi uridine diphosphate-N- acetylglucosamine transporter [Ascosphaera pollenicola]|nr:golgi uridine diphosphate-N- acetylglucosamine transporter [Ascosphaera pollenicola]